MDVILQHVAECGVHQPVTGERCDTAKSFRYDADPKMTLAARRSGVSGMSMAFIFDDELKRRECLVEALAHPRFAGRARHGGAISDCGTLSLILPCSQIT